MPKVAVPSGGGARVIKGKGRAQRKKKFQGGGDSENLAGSKKLYSLRRNSAIFFSSSRWKGTVMFDGMMKKPV